VSKKKSETVIAKTKHQRFEMRTMRRSEIREAPYNPRLITEQNKKKLKGKIKEVGLLTPLVVNARTGNLVSGHQRLASIDSLERGREYEIDVSVIDVDEQTEKEMVVFFNNPSAQGEWNLDMLADLNLEHGIDFAEMGFEAFDVNMLFEGDARFARIFVDEEEIVETGEKLREIKEQRGKMNERMQERNQGNFYFTVVCRDDGEKKELLTALGVPVFEQFVEGAYVMENLRQGPLGRVKKHG